MPDRNPAFLLALFTLWWGLPIGHCAPAPPNIVVLLADDMGFSDLGCTGSEIETPHLDKLANDGVLFTQCYNTSRCCPSRAALLTGRYQWDAGLGHMNTTKSPYPEYQQVLSLETPTLAEALRDIGYQTFMAGKWHVGDPREHWPDKRGFDHFYGTPTGGGLYFFPSPFYDRPIYRDGTRVEPEGEWYSTDGFTDGAIDFLRTQRDPDHPFFLYLAYIAPHFPLQAKAEDIEKYQETYRGGYEPIRRRRFAKQRRLGVIPDGFPLSEPTYPDWNAIADPAQEARKMAVYAAQVDCMDQNIGRLITTLRDIDALENTLILFLSDNGACATDFNRTPSEPIGSRLSNATYGPWHNVSNTPYRLAKRQEHEGGIATPLIAYWPEGILDPGRIVDSITHIMDVFPTCLEIAQIGNRVAPESDGESFASVLKGQDREKERALFWEHEGNRAARLGDWKLVAVRGGPWELYNLAADPFETIDLAADRPEKRSQMERLYADWAEEHGVRPWPLPKPSP